MSKLIDKVSANTTYDEYCFAKCVYDLLLEMNKEGIKEVLSYTLQLNRSKKFAKEKE